MSGSFLASIPPEVPFPEPFRISKPESSSPPVPVIYETTEVENISLRAYAAIQLRVPDSGIDWLDHMIQRSRKLDGTCSRAKSK